jgi:hypothetical protein
MTISIRTVIARCLTVLAVAAAPVAMATPAEAASPAWNRIIECESGGHNIESHSRSSSASGYLQFTDGTWKHYGGREFARRAIDASREEQLTVAWRAYEANGLNDWAASRDCWGGGGKTNHHRHRHHDEDDD